ncbi:hypothetical protein HDK90DRAFT_67502 [Phyllosticta capitalensis]|uniref:Secreted protein n=1 Tax=Phyllosticta capitalensis TaxID=121624 RepID=A0ABR1YC99_9PEZI
MGDGMTMALFVCFPSSTFFFCLSIAPFSFFPSSQEATRINCLVSSTLPKKISLNLSPPPNVSFSPIKLDRPTHHPSTYLTPLSARCLLLSTSSNSVAQKAYCKNMQIAGKPACSPRGPDFISCRFDHHHPLTSGVENRLTWGCSNFHCFCPIQSAKTHSRPNGVIRTNSFVLSPCTFGLLCCCRRNSWKSGV